MKDLSSYAKEQVTEAQLPQRTLEIDTHAIIKKIWKVLPGIGNSITHIDHKMIENLKDGINVICDEPIKLNNLGALALLINSANLRITCDLWGPDVEETKSTFVDLVFTYKLETSQKSIQSIVNLTSNDGGKNWKDVTKKIK